MILYVKSYILICKLYVNILGNLEQKQDSNFYILIIFIEIKLLSLIEETQEINRHTSIDYNK